MKNRSTSCLVALLLVLMGLLLTGCGEETVVAEYIPLPTATNAPIFTNGLTMEPVRPVIAPDREATVSPLFDDFSGTTAAIEATIAAKPQPTQTLIPTAIPTEPARTMSMVYFDGLATDWNVQSTGAYIEQFDGAAATGDMSIAFMPEEGARVLLFTVREDAERAYTKEDVLGITLQLSSLDQAIGRDDVAMTVIGSNDYPYWVESDTSVQAVNVPNLPNRLKDDAISNAYADIYPETPIQYLYVARAIQPNTWVPVSNYLPERTFSPDYTYVTGFYIKVHQSYQGTILIDDIRIVEWGN